MHCNMQHCQHELTAQKSEHTSLTPQENALLGQSEIDEIKELTHVLLRV